MGQRRDLEKVPCALEAGGVNIRDTALAAWLDAIVLGVGFYREPNEALASRDPGKQAT